ncbi:hypothetical protein [Clostridium lundense]|uniref:hypothetical protein n=1 Tax=Clostridium lundense TaxID=319475 RepID=UPI0004858284|nr:hypothetical protein [Clostridium lundense]
MKKMLIFISLILSLSIYLSNYHNVPNDGVNTISIQDFNYVEIIKKTPNKESSVKTSRKESLEDIAKFIDSLDIKSTKKMIDEPKVDYKYDFRFSGKGKSYITFYGNLIRYNGIWYNIGGNIDDKLNSLFDSLAQGI